jgi:hypothetical protein
MSLASRQPYTSTIPASWPTLVDRRTGRVDRAALRGALRAATRRPFSPQPVAATLADLMQRVRLQRKWAAYDIASDADAKVRADAERAALETEAQQTAERCNFNTGFLHARLSAYQFGSLADAHRAPSARRLYRRALDIAIDHVGAQQIAAE